MLWTASARRLSIGRWGISPSAASSFLQRTSHPRSPHNSPPLPAPALFPPWSGPSCIVTGILVRDNQSPRRGPSGGRLLGLKLRVSAIEGPNSSQSKLARAFCGDNSQVVGGGWLGESSDFRCWLGDADPTGAARRRAWHHLGPLWGHGPGTQHRVLWRLVTQGLCAVRPLPDLYQIVPGAIKAAPAGSRVWATAAVCPPGKRVIGTGGEISNIRRIRPEFGLQLSRASGPLDISRATARENGLTETEAWTLRWWAVCRSPVPTGLAAEGTLTSSAGGLYTCSDSEHQLHSVGGGGWTATPPAPSSSRICTRSKTSAPCGPR